MKGKSKITRADYLKAARKARREEEISEHLRPVNINRVHQSKKAYNRKRNKADLNKDLPCFFTRKPVPRNVTTYILFQQNVTGTIITG